MQQLHQRDDGGTVGIQIARAGEATSRESASYSPEITIAPTLFSSDQAAQYLGMSEAKFHELRGAEWMCAAIVLGPRLIRWARADLDHVIAALPRQAAVESECRYSSFAGAPSAEIWPPVYLLLQAFARPRTH